MIRRLILSLLLTGLATASVVAEPVEVAYRLRVLDSTGQVVGHLTPTHMGSGRALQGLVPLQIDGRLLILRFRQSYALTFFSGPETVRFLSSDCSGPAFIAWHWRLEDYFAAVGRHVIYVPERTSQPVQLVTHSLLTPQHCQHTSRSGYMVPAHALADLRRQFTPPFRVVPLP